VTPESGIYSRASLGFRIENVAFAGLVRVIDAIRNGGSDAARREVGPDGPLTDPLKYRSTMRSRRRLADDDVSPAAAFLLEHLGVARSTSVKRRLPLQFVNKVFEKDHVARVLLG
jgi:hypothetical protein